ncbi:hypothetical protein VTO42DRAFT_6501 [Malbranchea cinnamomea]
MAGSSAKKRNNRGNNVKHRSQAHDTTRGTPAIPMDKTNGVQTGAQVALKEPKASVEKWDNVASAVAQSTLPAWVNVGIMVGLIFGGCCANVFALEAIIVDSPGSGALITFTQFIMTFLFTVPNFLSFSAGPRSLFLSKRKIPLKSWMIYTAFFMSVNLLNNAVFAFKVSVPVHIIVRSGGPVASMVVGYLFNSKRYTRTQVVAVALLCVGVVTAALADAKNKGKSLDVGMSGADVSQSLIGFSILGLAMILAAFQGVYADRLYEKHGRNHWREALFYSHALSLPFLIPSYPKLLPQLTELISSPSVLASLSTAVHPHSTLLLSTSTPTTIFESSSPSAMSTTNQSLKDTAASLLHATLPFHRPLNTLLSRIPIKILYLILNALTQYLCIRGVHLLSAKSSSLTVTVVLNIRKLVSLILSVYLFGNVLAPGVLLGAVGVFLGGGIYAYESARLKKINDKKALKKEKTG